MVSSVSFPLGEKAYRTVPERFGGLVRHSMGGNFTKNEDGTYDIQIEADRLRKFKLQETMLKELN